MPWLQGSYSKTAYSYTQYVRVLSWTIKLNITAWRHSGWFEDCFEISKTFTRMVSAWISPIFITKSVRSVHKYDPLSILSLEDNRGNHTSNFSVLKSASLKLYNGLFAVIGWEIVCGVTRKSLSESFFKSRYISICSNGINSPSKVVRECKNCILKRKRSLITIACETSWLITDFLSDNNVPYRCFH